MATPYPNNSSYNRERDAYNFYHSQLRIRIECAFGILTQRFGFLRKRAPARHKMKKVMAIVSSLCPVHNWLIDQRQGPITTADLPPHTSDDELSMALNGVVPMVDRPGHTRSERLLMLDAGNHFDDDPDRAEPFGEQQFCPDRL